MIEDECIQSQDISQHKWEEHREPTGQGVTCQRVAAFHTSVPGRTEKEHGESALNRNEMKYVQRLQQTNKNKTTSARISIVSLPCNLMTALI